MLSEYKNGWEVLVNLAYTWCSHDLEERQIKKVSPIKLFETYISGIFVERHLNKRLDFVSRWHSSASFSLVYKLFPPNVNPFDLSKRAAIKSTHANTWNAYFKTCPIFMYVCIFIKSSLFIGISVCTYTRNWIFPLYGRNEEVWETSF